MSTRPRQLLVATAVVAALAAACASPGSTPTPDTTPTAATGTTPSSSPSPSPRPADRSETSLDDVPSPTAPSPVSPSPAEPTPSPAASAPPAWLGTRVLEEGPTGFPPPQETPAELLPRSIVTEDVLPPPASDEFTFTVDPVPDEVVARSTWHPDCPIEVADLRRLTVAHLGFDGAHHTGEVLVHADAVDAVVAMFEAMHEADFPLEQVSIITPEQLDAPATGDGNITSAFVCRDSRGSGNWSEHAYGRALDINPFHNPYRREDEEGTVVLPELATAYTDRTLDLPGMLTDGHPVVEVIEDVGWHWGGHYQSLSDPMHVSATGR